MKRRPSRQNRLDLHQYLEIKNLGVRELGFALLGCAC